MWLPDGWAGVADENEALTGRCRFPRNCDTVKDRGLPFLGVCLGMQFLIEGVKRRDCSRLVRDPDCTGGFEFLTVSLSRTAGTDWSEVDAAKYLENIGDLEC